MKTKTLPKPLLPELEAAELMPLPSPEDLVRPVSRQELLERFSPEFVDGIESAGRLYNAQAGEPDWIIVRADAVFRLPHCEAAVAREVVRAAIERRDLPAAA